MLNIQRVLQTNLGYAKVNGNISSCLHIMNYSHNVVGDGGIYRKGKLIFKMLSGTELQVWLPFSQNRYVPMLETVAESQINWITERMREFPQHMHRNARKKSMISMVTNFVYPLQELQSWEFTMLMSANTNGGRTPLQGFICCFITKFLFPQIFSCT